MLDIEIKLLPSSMLAADIRFAGIRFPEIKRSGHFQWPLLGVERGEVVHVLGNRELLSHAEGRMLCVYVIQETHPVFLLQHLSRYYESQRPLNLIEKSNLLNVGRDMGITLRALVKEICPVLRLPPLTEQVKNLLFLHKLPQALRNFIIDKSMGLRQTVVFQRCGKSFDWVVMLVERGKVSLSLFLEIVNTVWEISQRDNKTIGEVLDEVMFNGNVSQGSIPALRDVLWRKRFPILSEANRLLELALERLDLPSAIKITWDRTLEREGIEVTFRANTVVDYTGMVGRLGEIDVMPLFEHDLLSGDSV